MTFHVFQLLQLVSLVVAFFCLKGLKQFKLTAFIPLLVIVCITEAIASNYKLLGWKSNYAVYDIYFVFSTPVLLYLSYNMLLYKGILKIIFVTLSIALTMFLLLNTLFFQGIHAIDTYSYLAAEAAMVIVSFLVILHLFLDDDTAVLLNQHPYFWISAVSVIFGIGVLFIMGISGYIKAHKIQINGRNIYQYVTSVLNYILYGGYIYAFILCRKLTTRSS